MIFVKLDDQYINPDNVTRIVPIIDTDKKEEIGCTIYFNCSRSMMVDNVEFVFNNDERCAKLTTHDVAKAIENGNDL